MQDDQHLLIKNKIVLKGKVKNKSKIKEDLQLLTFQKPNNKLFYVYPLRLAIYNMAHSNTKRETKFRWWIKNKLGEAPVVFKEPLVQGSAKAMNNYMFNLGYLQNRVGSEVKYKKKKAIVTYNIEPNKVFKINTINLPPAQNAITRIIHQNQKKTLLKKGDALNIDVLDAERIRLSNELRNRGYFFFNKEYLSFTIDTLNKKQKADLNLLVNAPKKANGQDLFRINEVYIYTDYKVEQIGVATQLDTIIKEGYYFVRTENNINPKTLLLAMFFKKGDYYSLEKHQKTQKKIVSFGAFKFVNIEYKLSAIDSNALDVFVLLTPAKKQSLSADFEVSHSFAGQSGTEIGGTYRNKNLSKRADLFEVKASAGVELNLFNRDTTLGLLNAADFNAEVNYYVNRFIVPFPLKNVSKNSNVKTKFSLKYTFENRFERFSRHSTAFTAGYEWNETQTKKHFYNPFSVSLLLIPEKHPKFQAQLDSLPSLSHSFEENIILGSDYTFLMTNKKGENDNSYFKFRGDINLAGNFVHLAMMAIKSGSTDTVPYKIFNKEYAQFARFEGNIIQYNRITNHSMLVSRFNAGIIIPYGNSIVAPYFQQFFVGGANSLRGFRLRALGPGSYAKESTEGSNYYDQTGDIKIEANVEYRIDLYKWFKWAFFVDAGNVWTLRKQADRPNGVFDQKFYQSIALSFGVGLRLDFDYFVIRTDLAMPVIDPRYPLNERWRLNKMNFKDGNWRSQNLIFNLAIGYPF